MKPRQPVFQGAKSDDESKDEEQQEKLQHSVGSGRALFYCIPQPHRTAQGRQNKKEKENYYYGKASVYFRVRYRRTSR